MKNLKGQVARGGQKSDRRDSSGLRTISSAVIMLVNSLFFSCGGKAERTGTGTPFAENFIGEWASATSPGRPHLVISRQDENFIIREGKKAAPGFYDKEHKLIKYQAGVPLDIMLIEKDTTLIVAGFGTYTKVRD